MRKYSHSIHNPMWTSLCMLESQSTAVLPLNLSAFLRLMWLVLLCVCVVCALREQLHSCFLFYCSFSPCSRSCLVNPMKINVLSTGKPQQCPSVLTNSKHRMCLPAGNGVQFCVAWTWCYAASLRFAFFNWFPPFCIHVPLPLSQARRELKRLKEEARRKHAIAVIWAYWLGLKVSSNHRYLPGVEMSGKRAHNQPLSVLNQLLCYVLTI